MKKANRGSLPRPLLSPHLWACHLAVLRYGGGGWMKGRDLVWWRWEVGSEQRQLPQRGRARGKKGGVCPETLSSTMAASPWPAFLATARDSVRPWGLPWRAGPPVPGVGLPQCGPRSRPPAPQLGPPSLWLPFSSQKGEALLAGFYCG